MKHILQRSDRWGCSSSRSADGPHGIGESFTPARDAGISLTRLLAATTVFCLSYSASGCAAPICSINSEATAPSAWPTQLAGRKLRVHTEDYALYANDAKVAEELAEWLDEQLATFYLRYGRKIPGPGIVFAIESEEEPFPAAEDARKRDLERHLPGHQAKIAEPTSMLFITPDQGTENVPLESFEHH